MENANQHPELDSVLEALSQNLEPRNDTAPKKEDFIFDEKDILQNLMEEIYNDIERDKEVLDQTKDLLQQTGEPDYATAYSNVSKNQTERSKLLVSLIIEREKLAQAKALKTRDLDLKEKALAGKIESRKDEGTKNITNNNLFITGNREDIFDAFCGSSPEIREKARLKLQQSGGPIIDIPQ